MYNLGIIGGMGSEATVEFFDRLLKYDNISKDQDYLNICILNKSTIYDRTNYIINRTENPINDINICIEELSSLRCEYFVIACNTAHYFVEDLVIPQNISFINMVDETLNYIDINYNKSLVCILGTEGTIKGKVYEKYNYDLNIIYPNETENELLMNIIYSIKAKKNSNDILRKLTKVIDSISKKFNDVVFVIACTELSIYCKYFEGVKFVDAIDILAKQSIKKCRKYDIINSSGAIYE